MKKGIEICLDDWIIDHAKKNHKNVSKVFRNLYMKYAMGLDAIANDIKKSEKKVRELKELYEKRRNELLCSLTKNEQYWLQHNAPEVISKRGEQFTIELFNKLFKRELSRMDFMECLLFVNKENEKESENETWTLSI